MAFDSFPYRQKSYFLVLNLPLSAKNGNFEPKNKENLADSIVFHK